MTTKGEWKEYTGSDEQIAEIGNSVNTNGFITKNISGLESSVVCSDTTNYWIIPDDPLREMKIRQAMTGQPVWIRWITACCTANSYREYEVEVTTTPDWYIPGAEYSFTPFKDELAKMSEEISKALSNPLPTEY